jgi:3-isopropylmalate/(R)-2-methylmalate dehydratase small subunit
MEIMNLQCVAGKAFLLGDDVNTDLNCSGKYLPGKSVEQIATVAFDGVRPGLAKDILAAQGGILVAGENFGINSSREQAIQILKMMQVKGIIAKSFGRQFFRNAINNGLAILECDTTLIQAGDHLTVNFQNGVVQTSGGLRLEAHQLPPEILALIECGGLIPFLSKHPDWKFST